MAITPAPTPRQVIPFGDRPIIDGRGHPTFEMYQWMQRDQYLDRRAVRLDPDPTQPAAGSASASCASGAQWCAGVGVSAVAPDEMVRGW
jgi:hypothetical protein